VYFVYITSSDVPAISVYSLYGTRWRIETAFRQIKDLQAKTRVINPNHRIWLFGVACLIYASWSYRHIPEDQNQILPEDLLSIELQLVYKKWMYNRTTIYELVSQYLIILDQCKSLYL
jgi:IS4 transposase